MAEKKEKRYVIDNARLMSEWDWEKNNELGFDPNKLTYGSGKKVWWKCNHRHEWQATIDNRRKGSQCPYCSGRLAIEGQSDLATTHPEIALEWHPTKNENLFPTKISIGSHKKVWWKCAQGHEWSAKIYSRKISGCPICTGEKRTSFPEQAIYFYMQQITIAYNRYMLKPKTEIDVFLPELKIGIEYDGAYFHSSEEANLRENRKNTELSLQGIILLRIKETSDRTVAKSCENIIYCKPYPDFFELKNVLNQLISRINIISKNTFVIDVNIERDRGKIYAQYVSDNKEASLQIKNPDLAAQWHPYKNERITPLMVTPSSSKRVWWLCSKGHEWQAPVYSRNNGNGCPECKRAFGSQNQVKSIVTKRGSLASSLPEVAVEWHPIKNEILYPTDVTVSSGKKVWWLCHDCGHEWQAIIASRSKGHGCPECAKQKRKKKDT